jgi:hypothetical protein
MTITLTDQKVRDKVSEIVSSKASSDEKYQMLDDLMFLVENYHPQRMAADVLQVVSAAQVQMIYAKGGDPTL